MWLLVDVSPCAYPVFIVELIAAVAAVGTVLDPSNNRTSLHRRGSAKTERGREMNDSLERERPTEDRDPVLHRNW